MENVRQQVSRAAAELRGAGAAHGDLQHGNILVRADNTIRLVDYDGMYLPRLCRLGAPEQGHRHYQHPRRGDSFDDTIDAFPAAVIDLSLAALQRHPELWHQHYNEDNLLLTASDFAAPEQSELFARLCRLEPVAERAERLKRACTTEFSFVSDVLGGSRVHHPAVGGSLRSPNALPVIRATQPDTLRARQGDNVTVFGRVTSTKVHPTRGNRALVNINFGDYRKADFTIVAFDSACAELQERFGAELAGLNRRWVSLTGLVELYQSRWSTNLTPQIHLGRARALRLLDEAQVEALRSAADSPNSADDSDAVEPGWSAVTKTTTRRQGNPPASPEPRRSSRPAEAEDVETRLSQLYSSPRFASRTPPGYSGTNGPPAVGGNGRTAAQGPSSQRSSSTPSPPPPATPPPPPGLSAPKPPAGTSPTSPASGTPLHGDAFRADSRRGQGALRRFLRMLRRK